MVEADMEGEQDEVDSEEGMQDFMSTEQVDEEIQTLAAGLASKSSDELTKALHEMLQVMGTPRGGKVLVQYVLASPRCVELLSAWEAGSGAPTAVPLMLLLCEIFRHPAGKGEGAVGPAGLSLDSARKQHKASSIVQVQLDKLARVITRSKMKDVYSHLSSSQRSRQKAALKFMTSIVLRGRLIAVEVATNFDFTLESLKKLAQHPHKARAQNTPSQGHLHLSSRYYFIEFALSFLVVGDPELLRWILQKRPLYAGVLHSLAKDEESTIVQVLTVLQEKVMSPAALVPTGLQSAVFGDVALEQLARIAGDNLIEGPADLAYQTLTSLCTDPSHGLCPELMSAWGSTKTKSGAHGGNQGRLLRLMLRLRATEVFRHRELLLATARSRPKLAAAYLDSVPYTLEPRPSPSWFAAMSLVADLIFISSTPPSFLVMASQGLPAPALDGPLVRSNLRRLLPRALTKVMLNRGLQHTNVLVRHVCMRVVLEALLSLERLLNAVKSVADTLLVQKEDQYLYGLFECTSRRGLVQESQVKSLGCMGKLAGGMIGGAQGESKSVGEIEKDKANEANMMNWLSLGESIQDTLRASLPDPNVLLISYSYLRTVQGELIRSNENRKRNIEEGSRCKRRKKENGHSDGADDESDVQDIVSDSEGDTTRLKNVAETTAQIWGVETVVGETNDVEGLTVSFLHTKVLEVLAAYQRVLPVSFADKGFDPFKLLPTGSTTFSSEQEEALLSLLLATTGAPEKGHESENCLAGYAGTAGAGPMYKHIKPFLKMMVNSNVEIVRAKARLLVSRIMTSTGAFESNAWEITIWLDQLLILEGNGIAATLKVGNDHKHPSQQVLGSIGESVLGFLSEAVATVGRTLYKYVDQVYFILSASTLREGAFQQSGETPDLTAPDFGPFVVCALEHTLRVVRSDSKSLKLPQRTAISLYVASVLEVLLQTQTDARVLGVVITSLLSSEFDLQADTDLKIKQSEWNPLWGLYGRACSILDHPYSSFNVVISTPTRKDPHVSGQLEEVLKYFQQGHEIDTGEQRLKLASVLVCASLNEVIKYFPLLIDVCSNVFEGKFPVLITMCELHHGFLSEVDFMAPSIKKSKHKENVRGQVVSALLSEIVTGISKSAQSSAPVDILNSLALPGDISPLCRFLKCLPISVLFPSVMHSSEGEIFTSEILTAALYASFRTVSVQDRQVAMRMILTYIHRLSSTSLTSSLARERLELCFSLLRGLVVLCKNWNTGGEEYSDIREELEACTQMIVESLAHPVLARFCMCPTRIEASSGKEVRLMDGFIIEYLKSLLEVTPSLYQLVTSNTLGRSVANLEETTLLACQPFVLKAMTTFRMKLSGKVPNENAKTFCEDFSTVLNFVTQLAPYADPQVLLDFLIDLISLKGARLPLGMSRSSMCLKLAQIFFASFLGSRPKFQTLRRAGMTQAIDAANQAKLVDIFRYIVKEALQDPEGGDLCLLSSLQAPVLGPATFKGQFSHLLSLTPIEVLKYCVQDPTEIRGKIASILVQGSPIHMSEFGRLLMAGTGEGVLEDSSQVEIASKLLIQSDLAHDDKSFHLSNEKLLELLPAAEEYLARSLSRPVSKVVTQVASAYLKLLGEHFQRWDNHVEVSFTTTSFDCKSLRLFDGVYTMDTFLGLLCMGPVRAFMYCLQLSPLSRKKCLSLLRKLLPKEGVPLFGITSTATNVSDRDMCMQFLIAYGKVEVAKQLFSNISAEGSEENNIFLDKDADKETVLGKRKRQVADITIRFAGNILSTLDTVFRLTTQLQAKSTIADVVESNASRVANLLEGYLLAQLIKVVEVLDISQHESQILSLFKAFARSSLRYKFGEIKSTRTLRAIVELLTHASEDQAAAVMDSVTEVLELVLAHSQFVPFLLSSSSSVRNLPLNFGRHAGKGTFLSSLPSVLSLIGSPFIGLGDTAHAVGSESYKENSEIEVPICGVADSGNSDQEEFLGERTLELVKLIRLLFQLKMRPGGMGLLAEDFVTLGELLSLLLASYGATLDNMDQELLTLMRELEAYGGKGFSGLAGMDFLWGEAALKRRRATAKEKHFVDEDFDREETTRDARKQTFREDVLIDPRRCGLLVLLFPATTELWKTNLMPSRLEETCKKSLMGSSRKVKEVEEQGMRVAAYDPAYILPFALHGLTEGCMDAEEFVRLGMLAVALASLSSSEESMRKLGYDILAKYLTALEEGSSFKGRPQIRLLLTYVKNAITEAWQQLPYVLMLFAAEASCILMHPENPHYLTITRYLLRGPAMDLEYVPLFHSMFGSGSPRYRSERLWMLRLLACGLASSQDSRVYRRQFVLEILMSFYGSPLADTFSRKWVLQVMRKAAGIRACAQALVERTGFLPWLAFAAVRDSDNWEQEGKEACDLAIMGLEILESLLKWRFVEQRTLVEGMEELTTIALGLHQFMSNIAAVPKKRAVFRRPAIRVMTFVLRLSQRRKKHNTHFSLSLLGLVEVIQWVESEGPDAGFGIVTTQETLILALQMLLQSSPPAASSREDKVLLCQIAAWAVPVALQMLIIPADPEHCEDQPRRQLKVNKLIESVPEKLLRWLAASLILGKTAVVADNQVSAHILAETTATCWAVLVGNHVGDNDHASQSLNCMLAHWLVELQRHIVGEVSMFTVVSSLAALWPFSELFFMTGAKQQRDEPAQVVQALVHFLLDHILAPQEVDPSWRWSFNNPWRSKQSLKTKMLGDNSAMQSPVFQTEVCQVALTIFQQLLLGGSPSFLAHLISQWTAGLADRSKSFIPQKFINSLDLLERMRCALEKRTEKYT